MNRIYRSLWNSASQTFVAAAEHVCGRGARSTSSCSAEAGKDDAGIRRSLRRSILRPLALEQRFMFDGAAVATAVDVVHDATPVDQPVTPQAVVFVDARVQDKAQLVAGLAPNTEVVQLSQNSDGLDQIAAYLSKHQNVGSLQIFAHGWEGNLWLGSTFVDQAALNAHQADLTSIGRSLTPDGDILIYACNTAAGTDGLAFVNTLSRLTGADVAASDNRTGTGGDWNLEIVTGSIEAAPVLSADAMAAYDHSLATLTVTTTDEPFGVPQPGTLVDCINKAANGDTITFATAHVHTLNYVIQPLGKSITFNGDLNGDGVADVTLDGGYKTSLISISSGNVTLNGLIFTRGLIAGTGGSYNGPNGVDALGAGVSVYGGTTTITDCKFIGNVATGGGAFGSGGNYAGAGGGGGSGFAGIGGGRGGNGDTLPGYIGSNGGGGTGGNGGSGAYQYASRSGKGGTSGPSGSGGAGGDSNYLPIGYFSSGGSGGRAGNALTGYAGGGGGGLTMAEATGMAAGNGGNAVGALFIDSGATVYIANTSFDQNLGAGGGGAGSSQNFASGNGGTGVGAIMVKGSLHYQANTVSFANNSGAGGMKGNNESYYYFNGADGASADNIYTSSGGYSANWTVVTDANIAISGASGSGGAYKIGDVVTATWDNSASGDNNANVTSVTVDFTQFGGYSNVVATSDGAGHWTATYTIVGGSIDATNRNVSVRATSSGIAAIGSDTSNATVDNVAPTITDARITISGASGIGGTYRIGDTITATWDNSAFGDNNSDTISSVSVDLSQFGGGTNVSATNDGNGRWSASYTIVSGGLDTTGRNVTFTVTDDAGNSTTRTDSSNASIDSINPSVSSGSISISGATGTGGVYRIGDTVTATWDNSASGDNNFDTLSGVTADFSQFGGGTNVLATHDGNGHWSATYTIVSGSIDATNRNVSFSVTDNAGNTRSQSGNTNASVDNIAPTTSISNPTLSADTGYSASDFITQTANQTITATLSAPLAGGETVYGSVDNGGSWTDITSKVSGTTLTWEGVTLTGNSTLKLKITDASGNDGTALSQGYTLDNTAPSAPSAPNLVPASDSGISTTDNLTNVAIPTFTGTAEAGSTVTLYDTDGTTILGTTIAVGGNWSITATPLAAGAHVLTARATDAAGNVSSPSSSLTVNIDTSPPTGFTLSNTTIASSTAISGASITNLSASDAQSITYNLATGSGSNDADNSRFTVSGNSLQVGDTPLTAGTYHIYAKATDAAGNTIYQAFTLTVVDAPIATSIVRSGGASTTVATTATSINYTVTFDQAVSGVDASDFTVTGTGSATGSVASVSGSGTTYVVTVNGLSGDGTLRLDLKDSGTGIKNSSTVDIFGGYTSGATYTLDHTAPAAPTAPDMTSGSDTGISNSDNITNDTTPTLTGNAEAGSTVTLYATDGITVLGTTTADGAGDWSITSIPLSSGSHSLTVKATDAAGNTSVVSSALAFTIDTTAPTTPTSLDLTPASDSGTSSSDDITRQNTPTITGTAEAGSSVTLYDTDGITVLGTATANGAGVWSITTTPLADGSHSFTAKATDMAGNTSIVSAGLTVTIDTTAPAAPAGLDLIPAADSGTSSSDNLTAHNTPTLTGTAAAGSIVTLYDTDGTTVLGTATANGAGAWSITAIPLADGIHNLTAKATDTAGNTSVASAGLTLAIDTTAPVAPSGLDLSSASDSGTSNSDNITTQTTPTITGTAEAGSAVTLYDSDGTTVLGTTTASGAGTWSITTIPLSSGSHSLTAKTMDSAGNISAVSASLTVTIDTTAPVVASVDVPAINTYKAGQTLSFTVNASEAITVNTTGGTPQLALDIGGVTRYATYASGSGSTALVFTYTIQPGETDSNGIAVTSLQSNGGTLTDAAGNNQDLTLNNVASTAGVLVDTTAPTVNSVLVPANGTYYNGQHLDFTVNFSETMLVDTSGGIPRIAITLDTGGTVYADYLSGSGTSSLVFRHSVANGEKDSSGITIGALSSNGGTLRDVAGNDATLILNGVGSTAAVDVDGTQPSILNVTSTTANGSYKAGDSIYITLTFSTAIDVDTSAGTPTLALGSGGTATYMGGSGSTNLVFIYTVGAGENSADLDYASITALALNAGTIKDSNGSHQDALLNLFAPGTAGSLGANKAIVVDTTPPTISFSNTGFSADTGSSATDFITATAAQTITATLSGAPAGSDRVYGSLNGGTTWIDITSKVTGTTLTWDGVTLTGSGTLLFKVTDAVGNEGALHSQAYTLDTSAPAAPTALDLAAASDSGSSNSDNLTRTTTPTLTGTAEAGSRVTLYDTDGSTVLGTTSADGAGNWSITSTALSAGSHTLTAKATDAAGNTSLASSGLTITIDTTAPTAPSAPDLAAASDSGNSSNDNLTRTTTPTLTGTAEPGSLVTLYDTDGSTVLGTTTADGAGNWSITSAPLASGSHTLTARATDAAGNTSVASSGLTLTIDTTAPTAPSAPDLAAASDSGGSNSDNITRTTTPTITGTAEAGSSITLYDSNGTTVLGTATTDGAGNWSITSSALASGSHTLSARATDAAGNTSVASSGLAITIDTAAPSVSLTTLSAGSTTPVLSGTANEGMLSITVGGATYSVTPAGGVWHLDLATAVPTSGSLALQLGQSYSVAISATDAAGNTSSTTQTLTLIVVPNPPMPQPNGPSPAEIPPPQIPLSATTSANSPSSFLSAVTEAAFNDIPSWPTSSSDDVVFPDNGSLGALLLGGKPGNGIQGGLVVRHTVPDQVFESTGAFEIRVPGDTFVNLSSDADIQILAAQANGKPLPDWIKFDPAAGKFIVQPPPGVSGELVIRLVARDLQGNEAVTTFKIRVGGNRHAAFEYSGRPGLSEQIRLAARASSGGLSHLRDLPNLRELRLG